MPTFSGQIQGYEVVCEVWSGQTRFRVPALNKEFTDPDKMEKAIQAYDLSLRKDFTNRTAYQHKGGYGRAPQVIEVEVTSVVDEKEAWVKTTAGRSKAMRSALYADKDQVLAAIKVDEECAKRQSEAWDAVKRWEPQS